METAGRPLPAAAQELARDLAQALVGPDSRGAELPLRVGELEAIGRQELIAAAEVCRAIADRRTADRAAFRAALRRLGGQTTELVELAKMFVPSATPVAEDGYFERCLAAEPQLRAVAAGLTLSLETVRQHKLELERDANALFAARGGLDREAALAAAVDEQMSQRTDDLPADLLTAIRSRRQDLLVQLAIVDQAIAGLTAATEIAKLLVEAVDHARAETVLALQTVALAARKLARSRVIVERIRAESAAIAALVGGPDERPGRAQPPQTTAPGQWQALAVAWQRVQHSAAAIEALGLAADA